MATTSRVPATIDALMSTLAAPLATAGKALWDGPVVTGDYTDSVHIGYDGDPEGDYQTADPGQEWAGIGAKKRDEEFDIICAAVALVGGGTTKQARDTAYAMTEIVEDALRSDPSLGLGPPTSPVFSAEFRGGPVFTEDTSAGWQVRILFNIHVKTRI